MAAILTFLLVIAFSMLVTKIATIALVQTGMSRDVAQFQARSALSGAGFTTAASEKVVNHPVRRRIISSLILLGGAGLITAISSLFLGFANTETSWGGVKNLAVLFLGFSLLLLSTRSQWIDYWLSTLINTLLDRYTDLRVNNLSQLISLSGDYEIAEVDISDTVWLADQTIESSRLIDDGIVILGIYRGPDEYIGTPRGDHEIQRGDRLVVYGRNDDILNISRKK